MNSTNIPARACGKMQRIRKPSASCGLEHMYCNKQESVYTEFGCCAAVSKIILFTYECVHWIFLIKDHNRTSSMSSIEAVRGTVSRLTIASRHTSASSALVISCSMPTCAIEERLTKTITVHKSHLHFHKNGAMRALHRLCDLSAVLHLRLELRVGKLVHPRLIERLRNVIL